MDHLKNSKIVNVGTSMYVQIPAWFLQIHGIRKGDVVKRAVEGNRLIIEFEDGEVTNQ